MTDIIGKTVVKAYINADRTTIRFLCSDDTWVDLNVWGECCSESWIEHIEGVQSLLTSRRPIDAFEEVELGEAATTRQDRDIIYAFRLQQRIGTAPSSYYLHPVMTIEFRNSSNGYYGGSLAIRAVIDDITGFTELTEDF